MKTILLFLLSFGALKAFSNTSGSFTTSSFTTVGSAYDIQFDVNWSSDDFPMNSAPGRIEVLDANGVLVGSVVASDYEEGGPAIDVSGSGSVDGVSSNVGRHGGGAPADGLLSGTWHLTGLAPGNYSVRAWHYKTWETLLLATTVFTHTTFVSGSEPVAPPPIQPTEPEPPAEPSPPPPPPVYSLATSANAGGSVTPGGSYPAGSLVTVTAVADAAHYFGGWAGDAAGVAPSATLTVDRDLTVAATFIPKGTQAISFAPLSNLPAGAPPQTLSASSSSGLPVTFTVISGPASLTGNILTVTGPGTVTILASQNGDGMFLPAAPVTRSLTTDAPCVVRYQNPARTLLGNAEPNAHYVLPSLP